MKIETTKGALLEAFGAVDLGAGGTPVAMCGINRRGETVSVSDAGLLRYHSIAIESDAKGARLRTETFGTSYVVAAEAMIADAYVSERGRYIIDLATFRDAVKRLDKACGKSKRGARTPVTLTCRSSCDPLFIEAMGVRIPATPRQAGAEGGPELYIPAAGQPFALRAEGVAVLSALTDEIGRNDDCGLDSVAISSGHAFVTDNYFLATAPIPLAVDDLAVPREVVGKLARSTAEVVNGQRYDAQTAYVETGALRISWRWHGEGACSSDRCLSNAKAAVRMIDTALKSRPVMLKTADILRAARELKAFCIKGKSTLFLPHELGARLVRWDVKDDEAYIRENETWRAETVLPADWPIPVKFAINLGFLEKVAKKAGEAAVELLMGDELIAYRSPGSQIVRLSTQSKCPFADREGI